MTSSQRWAAALQLGLPFLAGLQSALGIEIEMIVEALAQEPVTRGHGLGMVSAGMTKDTGHDQRPNCGWQVFSN